MTDSMLIQMRTFMFQEKLLSEVQEYPYSTTAEIQAPRDWMLVVAGAAAALAGIATASLLVIIVAAAISVAGVILGRRETITVPVKGTIGVRLDHYANYPENRLIVDDTLGCPVRYQTLTQSNPKE